MGDPVSSIFYHAHHDFGRGHDASFGVGATAASSTPEDLFSIFDGLEGVCEFPPMTPLLQDGSTPNEAGEEMKNEAGDSHALVSQKSSSSMASLLEFETSSNDVVNGSCSSSPDQKNKRQKVMPADPADKDGGRKDCINPHPADLHPVSEDQRMQKMSHITVERNRRKQMNEHLSVLRSLMPCFYVKRGDQASIIGGVVEYISELQTLLQSLESKKQRKAYSDVLSPRLVSSSRLVSSPRPSQPVISPTKKPPLSPRLPISPRTPTPGSPYNRPSSRILSHQQQQYHHLSSSSPPPPPPPPTIASSPSSTTSSSTNNNNNNNNNINDAVNELVARLKSPMADVEVRFSGANVEVNTVSSRWIQGQVTKMISSIEHLSLEILSLNVNTIEDTMITSFTIKIGIECQLSAEDLAHQIQQTLC